MDLGKLDSDMRNGNKMIQKVSCLVITYNQKEYIKQCIDGIAMQKTSFPFEIIIGDDDSTDGTREILIEYASKVPNIKLNLSKIRGSGIPGKQNFMTTLEMCNGQYVSLCDGDDYWTDPYKLQKQVDFLDANLEYALCFHQVAVLKNETIEEDVITKKVTEITTISDLAKGNYIHTCSVVYRNNLFQKLPDYFLKAPIGDYFLHMLNARFGKIKCINEKMAVYRLHETSVWSSKKQKEREVIWIDFIKKIKPNFEKKIQLILDEQIQIIQRKNSFKWVGFISKIKKKLTSIFSLK